MEKKKNIFKERKFWIAIIGIIIILITFIFFILRNKMTAEETVSRFMYLIENKDYEKAKKLCSGDLEKLDILSNIKPTNFTFDYSEDKKKATAVISENELESTNINISIKNTLFGYKIQNYEVVTDLINPQIIEDRLKQGEIVSDIQQLYWGESEYANKEEIAEYIKDNAIVAIIFAETMKTKNYSKANEMYEGISETDLTVDNLKEYNWDIYEVTNNFKIMEGPDGDFSSITIKLGEKNIWIYIAAGQIVSIIQATV